MSAQTTYTAVPLSGRKGQLADNSPRDIEAATADGSPRVGNLCLLAGSAQGALAVGNVNPLPELTVDVDAIIATLGSTAGVQTLTGSSLDGVVGGGLMNPARQISILPDAHGDWDPTIATVQGFDYLGNPIEEDVAIATSSTNATRKYFAYVTAVIIPAQTGTGGAATVGVVANTGIYAPGSVGVPVRDTSRSPLDANDALADDDSVDALKDGKIYVVVEDTVTSLGQKVYVRTQTVSTDIRGQWRGSPAAGFSPLPWARFENLSDADKLVVLNLKP